MAVVHILERPRSSVHYAGPYPHYRLHANGEMVLSSPAPEAAGITNPSGLTGGRTVAYEDLGGGSFIHGADLSMRFTPANNKAERQVGIDFTEPEAKISRYNATIFVDDKPRFMRYLISRPTANKFAQNSSMATRCKLMAQAFQSVVEPPCTGR